jgi:hypothetical protein
MAAALGGFINEVVYMRSRISVLEEDKAAMRREVLILERLLQTKVDAKDAEEKVREMRSETLEWQERIDARLRAVEVR